MKRLLFAFFAFTILPYFAYAQLSGTYTINPDGSGAQNFKSIHQATDSLVARGISNSVVFEIEPGSYIDSVVLRQPIAGASKLNTITFRGDTLDSSLVSIDGLGMPAIQLSGAKHIHFESLTLASAANAYVVLLQYGADSIVMDGCEIQVQNANYTSILSQESHGLHVLKSRVYVRDNGILVYGSYSNPGMGVVIQDCQILGGTGYAIYLNYLYEAKVIGNSCKRDELSGIGTAIRIENSSGDTVASNRLINYGTGLRLGNLNSNWPDSSYIVNNMVVAGSYAVTTRYNQYVHFFHNTFYASYAAYCGYFYRNDDCQYLNNLFAGDSLYQGLYMYRSSPISMDYNAYSFKGVVNYIYKDGTYNSFEDFLKGDTTQHRHSLKVDAQFWTQEELLPYADSTDGAGIDLGIPFDIDGHPRPHPSDKKVDIGCLEYHSNQLSLKIGGLLTPSTLVVGINAVKVDLRHWGTEEIKNSKVQMLYSIDSGKNWVLDTLEITSMKPKAVVSFIFSQPLNIGSSGEYQLMVKIGSTISGKGILGDQNQFPLCTGLSGTYEVGVGKDFETLKEVGRALACGIYGPVVFKLNSGTYRGRLAIGKVPGASSANTIKFSGDSSDSTRVRLKDSLPQLVKLEGTSHITFEYLTIESTFSGLNYVLELSGVDSCKFSHCQVLSPRSNFGGNNVGITRSRSVVIENCLITGNEYAISLNNFSLSGNHNIRIESNHIYEHRKRGIQLADADGVNILNNQVSSSRTDSSIQSAIEIYLYRTGNFVIAGNNIQTFGTGIYTSACNSDSLKQFGEVVNNSIEAKGDYAINNNYLRNTRIAHNTVLFQGGAAAIYDYFSKSVHWTNNNLVGRSGDIGMAFYFDTLNNFRFEHNNCYFQDYTYTWARVNWANYNSLTHLAARHLVFNEDNQEASPHFGFTSALIPYSNVLDNSGRKTDIVEDINGDIRPHPLDTAVDIGAYEYHLESQNLAIWRLKGPISIKNGKNKIAVSFKNIGSDTILNNDVLLQYSTDSGKTFVDDTLSITSLAPGEVISFEFTRTWTPARNGDFLITIKINRSLKGKPLPPKQRSFERCSGLSGSYSVGFTGDYKTISEAVNALQCGVVGPVVFNIQDGTYNESIAIGKVHGTSQFNTITFKGSKKAVITHQADPTALNTWLLHGAEHISIEGVTIEILGVSARAGVLLTGNARYNTIRDCDISVSGSSYSACIALSGSSTSLTNGLSASYTNIDSNTFSGGYFGVYANSDVFNGSRQTHLSIQGNKWSDYRYIGLHIYGIDSARVFGNQINEGNNGAYYGMSIEYCNYFSIENNKVKNSDGINIRSCNRNEHNGIDYSTFINNEIICNSSGTGLYLYYSSFLQVYHNSIAGKSTDVLVNIRGGDTLDIRNNHFVQFGRGLTFYFDRPIFTHLDYNNYYAPKGQTLGYHEGSYFNNISSLRNSGSFNRDALSLNPLFFDDESDLHLTLLSPLMIGEDVGVAYDIDGDERCASMPLLGFDDLIATKYATAASINAPDTLWKNAPVTVSNGSKLFGFEEFKWYVDGVFVSDSVHLFFAPQKEGLLTISLVQNTCKSKDSTSKTTWVHQPIKSPTADFYAMRRDVHVHEFVELFNLSSNGATKFNWGLDPVFRFNEEFNLWDRGFYWSFRNDSTSANPKIEFYHPGLYQVCLKVKNVQGEDSICKSDFIKVRTEQSMCVSNAQTTQAYGTLYDDGGPWRNYSSGRNGSSICTHQIKNCNGLVNLVIQDLDIGAGDYLRIYDGSDNKGIPLWDNTNNPYGLTGSLSQLGGKSRLVAKSGSVFIEFESDWSNQTTAKGFAIDWDFEDIALVGPRAAFLVSDTVCVGTPIDFENISKQANRFSWDLYNDGLIDTFSKNFGHVFTSGGRYEVKLTVEDYCSRRDSLVKQIFVKPSTGTTKPRFMVNKNFGAVGDTFNLIDLSNLCTDITKWVIRPNHFYETTVGQLNMVNATVVFTRTGDYDVSLYKTNSFGTDSLVKVNYIQVRSYCEPTVNFVDSVYSITRVQFREIDQKSGVGSHSLSDYSNSIAMVELGKTYPLSLDISKSLNNKNLAVWVDWNADYDYDDLGEQVHSESIIGGISVFKDSITIPEVAVSGVTRMRIGLTSAEKQVGPCGGSYLGEFEEYSLHIEGEVAGAPRLRLQGNVIDTAHLHSNWTEPGYTAIDPGDGNITHKVKVSGSVNTSQPGRYVLQYSATNSALLTTSTKRYVMVSDVRPPEITVDDTMWLEVNNSFVPSNYTVVDGSDPNPMVKVYANIDSSRLGFQYAKYCAVDINGNQFCKGQVVVVYDNTSPIIQLNGGASQQVEVFHQYIDPGYTITDNDRENVVVTTKGNWTGHTTILGSYSQSFEAVDRAGNSGSATRIIDVVDRTPPVIVLNDSLVKTVQRWSEFEEPGFTVSDNYDDSSTVVVETSGTFESTQSEGVYYISYTAIDQSGNRSAPALRAIKVVNFTTIDEPISTGFEVYPNPASEMVHLNLPGFDLSNYRVVLTDFTGSTLIDETLGEFGNDLPVIDVSMLCTGIYNVQLISEKSTYLTQLVIDR